MNPDNLLMTLQLSFEGIHVGLEQGVDGLGFAFDGGELRIDCSNYSGQIVLSPLLHSARQRQRSTRG